jgi:hypothetical protein
MMAVGIETDADVVVATSRAHTRPSRFIHVASATPFGVRTLRWLRDGPWSVVGTPQTQWTPAPRPGRPTGLAPRAAFRRRHRALHGLHPCQLVHLASKTSHGRHRLAFPRPFRIPSRSRAGMPIRSAARHSHRSHHLSSRACPRSVLLLLQRLLVLLKAVSSPVSRAGSSSAEETGRSGRPAVNPPPTLADTSSGPSNRRNGVLGEPTSLPRPFPAMPGLPLTGIRPSPLLVAPRTTLQRSSSFQGPRCKN